MLWQEHQDARQMPATIPWARGGAESCKPASPTSTTGSEAPGPSEAATLCAPSADAHDHAISQNVPPAESRGTSPSSFDQGTSRSMDPSISTRRSAMCDQSRGRQEAAPDEGRQARALVAPKEEPPECAKSGNATTVVQTRLPGKTQVSGETPDEGFQARTRVATKDAAKPRRVVVEVECPLFALARGGNAVFNVSVVAPLENLYAKVRERIAKVVEKLRHEGFPFQASGLGEEINDYVNQFYLSRMDSERYTENGVHVFTHILYRDETLLDCMPTVIANQPTLSKLITEKSMELPPYPLLTAVLKSCVQHMFIIADAYESTVQQLGEPNHSLSDEIFWMNPGDTFQRHFVDMCNFFNRPVDDVRFVACDSDRKFFVVEPTDTPEKLHLRDQTELVMVNRALMSTIEFLQHRGSKLFTRPAGGV